MDKNLLKILIVATIVILIVVWIKDEKKEAELRASVSPIFFNISNYVTVVHQPNTTNISEIQGNGHTIGNNNTVKNEMECPS